MASLGIGFGGPGMRMLARRAASASMPMAGDLKTLDAGLLMAWRARPSDHEARSLAAGGRARDRHQARFPRALARKTRRSRTQNE